MSPDGEPDVLAVERTLLALDQPSVVPCRVTRVERVASGEVRVELELRYLLTNPVCCPEPGCYVRYLGTERRRVPGALREALALDAEPAVTVLASLVYEPGYQHTQLGRAIDCVCTYEPTDFEAEAT
jgi:hypothetical protein